MPINTAFSKGFQEIQDMILAMGNMVTGEVGRSVEALKKRDLKLAHRVIAGDAKIDEQRFTIEEKCIELMATQKPRDR